MKKLLLTLAAVLCLVGCKKDDPVKDNFAPIYINGHNTPLKAAQKQSVHDILTKNERLVLMTDLGYNEEGFLVSFGSQFDINIEFCNIDTINDRLIMEAGNVIDHGGMNELGGIFLKGRNYIIKTTKKDTWDETEGDTLGYIPNSVIRSAQRDILDLWAEGDIPTIYERFNESFYFIPCTAEEFKALKEEIDWKHEYDEIRAIHGATHEIKW